MVWFYFRNYNEAGFLNWLKLLNIQKIGFVNYPDHHWKSAINLMYVMPASKSMTNLILVIYPESPDNWHIGMLFINNSKQAKNGTKIHETFLYNDYVKASIHA